MAKLPVKEIQALAKPKARTDWLKEQNWLLIDEQSNTGQQLRSWMRRQGWRVEPTMQLDNFDLIINLVSLGMGISFIPIRALALYNQKRTLLRVSLPARFTRELVVVVRKHAFDVEPSHAVFSPSGYSSSTQPTRLSADRKKLQRR